jgi:hypothetical protein
MEIENFKLGRGMLELSIVNFIFLILNFQFSIFNSFHPGSLLISQRDHRIDLHRSSRGDVTRQQRDRCE